ncbi:hypothetical protein [Staphylococcus hominis]|uniref:hypothetical protein n=1 Tax=Staphylococcus hominis TaxID=1290 RepID=UPI0022E2E8E5|nr:hypothetical protein [Staphylococcus hominis]
MSDIIPFPQSKQKLYHNILNAQQQNKYKEMYQLFDIYEASFELDNQLSLIKCDMLNELGLYLELREEAIIFLKKGIPHYDELIIFYIKALIGLNQNYEAIEVINQIINKVKEHKTRMALFPLKEYAQSKLDEDKKLSSQLLSEFTSLDLNRQTKLMIKLIDNGHYEFRKTVAFLLSNQVESYNLKSLMLEYLRFSNYDSEIKIEKYGYEVNILPTTLKGLEHTDMKTTVIPKVLDRLENGALNIQNEAQYVMNNHSIKLYPLDIFSLFNEEDWIIAYDVYFKSMIGIEVSEANQELLTLIYQLDN